MIGVLTGLIRGAARRAEQDGIVRRPLRLPSALSSLPEGRRRRIEEAVTIGVLLQLVAHADDEFSGTEERSIARILRDRAELSDGEAALAVAAAREAREASVEIHSFTKEFSRRPYAERVEVIRLLFHLAYADRQLISGETEMIRKIAGLLWVEHKDFIAAKLNAADAAGARTPAR